MNGKLPTLPRRGGRLRQLLRNDLGRLITTGVPHVFVALLFTHSIGLLRRLLLAGILSVEELGQMAVVMQVADLTAIAADLGIATAVLKYAAEPVAEARKREVFVVGLLAASLVTTLVSVLYLAVVWWMPGTDADAALRLYKVMVTPYILFLAIGRIPLVYLQARKKMRLVAVLGAVPQAIGLLLLVGAAHFFRLPGLFSVVAAPPLVSFLLVLYVTRRDLQWFRPSWTLLRSLAVFGFVSMLTNAVLFANQTLTVKQLEWLSSSFEVVGYYSFALIVLNGVRTLPAALMQTAFPYLSGILHAPQRLRRRMWELAWKQSLLIAGITVAWALFGRLAIELTYGAKLLPAFDVALILLGGLVLFCIGAPAGQTLLALGCVHVSLITGTLMLTVTLVGNQLLIPRAGATGAAWTALIAQVAGSGFALVMAEVMLRRRTTAASPCAPEVSA